MLCHAEVEAFLEERVMEVVNRVYADWCGAGKVSASLIALLAYEEEARQAPTSVLKPPQKVAPNLNERIERAKNAFVYYVQTKNNGVKEDNILRMLLPLGVTEPQISVTWLSSMNSWGTGRGTVAHRAKGMQTALDPQTELNTVRGILVEIKRIDSLLGKL